LFMLLTMAMSVPMISRPSRKPATGAVTIGSSTFQKMPVFLPRLSPDLASTIEFQFMSEAASAAPHMPPISAWLEEDGRPNQQLDEVLSGKVAHRVGLCRIGSAVELEDLAVGLGLDSLDLVVECLARVDIHALAQQAGHLLDHLGAALEHGRPRGEVDFAQPP